LDEENSRRTAGNSRWFPIINVAQAMKDAVAWQITEAMKKKKLSKARMACLFKKSRTQVDPLLDPKNDITI
jgi:hypothetical protein